MRRYVGLSGLVPVRCVGEDERRWLGLSNVVGTDLVSHGLSGGVTRRSDEERCVGSRLGLPQAWVVVSSRFGMAGGWVVKSVMGWRGKSSRWEKVWRIRVCQEVRGGEVSQTGMAGIWLGLSAGLA